MDNDSKLLQWTRDTVKGVLFGIKYRGFSILEAQAGNDLIAEKIRLGEPFCAVRCGATEMRTAAEFLSGGYTEKTRAEIQNLSGVFPTEDASLNRFCETYIAAAHEADLLALWDVGAERAVAKGCTHARFTKLRALEPYYHEHPWSAQLAGKRVLVVHPFADTVLAQYRRREQLFPGTDILPEFASLQVIPAVQGLGGQDTGYESWFAALEAMEEKIAAAQFDVAIIGAGAYGLPLAVFCRSLGRQAVQMSGATQLLFGIKGKRWDEHPILSKLYNEAWVRPGQQETISNKDVVEGGSYW